MKRDTRDQIEMTPASPGFVDRETGNSESGTSLGSSHHSSLSSGESPKGSQSRVSADASISSNPGSESAPHSFSPSAVIASLKSHDVAIDIPEGSNHGASSSNSVPYSSSDNPNRILPPAQSRQSEYVEIQSVGTIVNTAFDHPELLDMVRIAKYPDGEYAIAFMAGKYQRALDRIKEHAEELAEIERNRAATEEAALAIQDTALRVAQSARHTRNLVIFCLGAALVFLTTLIAPLLVTVLVAIRMLPHSN